MARKPTKETGAPPGAPEDQEGEAAPAWLQQAMDWKPPPAVRGRKAGSRSTLTTTHGRQTQPVDNGLRDRALARVLARVASRDICSERGLMEEIGTIANYANVSRRTLKADLAAQLSAIAPGLLPPGAKLSFDTLRQLIEAQKRHSTEEAWLAEIRRLVGN